MENQKIGVINPFALAEVILGKRVRWDRVRNPEQLLESTLKMPIRDLFDPRKRSPLYPRLKMRGDSITIAPLDTLATALQHLDVREDPDPKMYVDFARRVNVADVRDALFSERPGKADVPWSAPRNAVWQDMGDFFEEGTEGSDPVQGALADCYFIAALSAVAWARPYSVVHRNRRTGHDQEAFVDRVTFNDLGKQTTVDIEVSERIPVRATTPFYARSREASEIWPAVYEKAYAKWKSGNETDQPVYPDIEYGSPVRATAELIGGSISSKATRTNTADDLWSYVRAHSLSYRTFDPMTAWTYSTAPDGVDYTDAKVVANHAYTVLGWAYVGGKKYIVARNPWGTYHAEAETLEGGWSSYDISYWRTTPLNENGVFAMEASAFKKYFAGIGHAQ